MSHDPLSALVGGIFGAFFLFYFALFVLSLFSTVFWIVEIVDVARREFPDPNTKVMWLLIVLLLHGIGALVYYFAGKPQGYLPSRRPTSSPAAQAMRGHGRRCPAAECEHAKKAPAVCRGFWSLRSFLPLR